MFRQIIIFLLLILIIKAKYLDNLDRTFSTGDDKVFEVSITMPDEEYKKAIDCIQVNQDDYNNKRVKEFETLVNFTISDNGDTKVFPETTLKLGGNYARIFSKPGFNIKLPTEYNNRKSFRLRTDVNDKSHIRQKLVCDICNRVGLPSIQSTFVRLTINGNLYGLYTLMDTLKPVNLKNLYNTKTKKKDLKVIKCTDSGFKFTYGTANICLNDNSDNEHDIEEFKQFLTVVENAKTLDDLDKVMNVDIFLKYIAIDWLIGSFDHLLVYGHNFYFFKNEINNKWDIIYYDFDNTLGQGIGDWAWSSGKNKGVWEFFKLSFKQFTNDQKIFDIAVNNDDTRFKKNVKEILTYGFNPTLLNAHIDDIKKLIDPYVKEEFVPINGELPGRVNKKGFPMANTYEEYQKNSEYETTSYTEIPGQTSYVPGVKYWIENSFKNACDQYGFDKDQILKNASSLKPTSFFTKIKNGISPYDDSKISEPVNENSNNAVAEECWSEKQGYSCCKNECNVFYTDAEGNKWGVENNQWCGIIKSSCQNHEDLCKSNSEYGCCNTCNQYYVDKKIAYIYKKPTPIQVTKVDYKNNSMIIKEAFFKILS